MKVFVAAPFAGLMKGRRIDKSFASILRAVIQQLRSAGFQTLNAHEQENWGESWTAPEISTVRDKQQIAVADLIVAIPGPPFSGGVHIELGWASAMGKPILVLLSREAEYSQLVLGLPAVSHVHLMYYDQIAEIPCKLQEFLCGNGLPVDAFYDAMSQTYDDFMKGDNKRSAQLEMIRSLGGKCLLDVGCGTGTLMLMLSKLGLRVWGIDCSQKMVEAAASRGLSTVAQGWAQNLPFEDEYFEVIYSIRAGFAYCANASEREAVAQELWRCLRPGGWILWDSPHSPLDSTKTLKWPSAQGIIETTINTISKGNAIRMFERSGFTVEKILGQFSPPLECNESSPRAIVLARKPLFPRHASRKVDFYRKDERDSMKQ